MSIAIIPARGGSKRIPRKNIKEFCGKPMITYAISAAKESGLFERIVVSTEDKEIALIANQFGAETPFVRPAALANDFTATVPVIAHAIEVCRALGWIFEDACCIYPCTPFIDIEDLIKARVLLSKSEKHYSFPVTEFPSAIQRALKRLDGSEMQPFYPQFEKTRTQDLESAYFDTGQFYWGKTEAWLGNSNIHSSGVGYLIPNWRVVDIDTQDDWKRAELLHQLMSKSA